MSQPPIHRALTLLAAASNGRPEGLALLPIGERDARLLTLREWTFGAELLGVAVCPRCGEGVELAVETAAIRTPRPEEASVPLAVCDGGWRAEFRLPNTLDVVAVGAAEKLEEARAALLERCLTVEERDG